MSKQITWRELRAGLIGALVVVGTSSIAGDVTIPHSFSTGTPISSSQMNANFGAVETAVDDNHARLAALESGIGRASAGEVVNVNCDAGSGGNPANLQAAIDATLAGAGARWFSITGMCSGIQFSDHSNLFFDAAAAGAGIDGGSTNAVDIEDVSDIEFENLTLSSGGNVAAFVTNARRIHFDTTTVSSSGGDGIFARDTFDLRVSNSTVSSSAGGALTLRNAKAVEIINSALTSSAPNDTATLFAIHSDVEVFDASFTPSGSHFQTISIDRSSSLDVCGVTIPNGDNLPASSSAGQAVGVGGHSNFRIQDDCGSNSSVGLVVVHGNSLFSAYAFSGATLLVEKVSANVGSTVDFNSIVMSNPGAFSLDASTASVINTDLPGGLTVLNSAGAAVESATIGSTLHAGSQSLITLNNSTVNTNVDVFNNSTLNVFNSAINAGVFVHHASSGILANGSTISGDVLSDHGAQVQISGATTVAGGAEARHNASMEIIDGSVINGNLVSGFSSAISIHGGGGPTPQLNGTSFFLESGGIATLSEPLNGTMAPGGFSCGYGSRAVEDNSGTPTVLCQGP